MSIEDILLALRASEEGAIDRDTLTKVLSIIDTWDRGGLHPSGGELLTKQFRVDPAKVRRWESEITGQSQRRIGRYQLRRKVGQGCAVAQVGLDLLQGFIFRHLFLV